MKPFFRFTFTWPTYENFKITRILPNLPIRITKFIIHFIQYLFLFLIFLRYLTLWKNIGNLKKNKFYWFNATGYWHQVQNYKILERNYSNYCQTILKTRLLSLYYDNNENSVFTTIYQYHNILPWLNSFYYNYTMYTL